MRESRWIVIIATLVKSATLLLGLQLIQSHSAWVNHTFVDIWGWLDFLKKSNEGLIPYVDFTKEYPSGAGLFYWMLAHLVPGNQADIFLKVHALVMSAWDVLNAFLFYRLLQSLKSNHSLLLALVWILTPTSLILSPVRFESVVLTTVILGYQYHQQKKYRTATLFWALGCCIKWFPILFIAAQELRLWWRSKPRPMIPVHGLQSGLIALGIFLAFNSPFLVIGLLKNGNIEAWLSTYWFHVHRPLYWDTVLGVMHLWWGSFPWEVHASLWSALLMLGVLVFRPAMRIEIKTTLMMIAALVFNRVYSTQFNLWFYPMLLILFSELNSKKELYLHLGLFFLLDCVNVGVYPFSFTMTLDEIKNFAPSAARDLGGPGTMLFSILIFTRTILLMAWAFLLIRAKESICSDSKA